MVDNIRCITIIHSIDRIKEYRWLSAFFRLIGIFVCENILGESRGGETDFTIKIDRHEGDSVESWEDITYKRKGSNEYLMIEREEFPPYREENWVNVILDVMNGMFGESTFRELQSVAEQFVLQDLMRGSYAIEYFGETSEKEIFEYMEAAKQRFFNAYQALKKLQNEHESKYLLAALCNCQRRVNELYTIIWNAINKKKLERKYIDCLKSVPYQGIDEIEDRIQRILYIDPEFYSAYAIKGFVAIIDEKRMLESINDFKSAVDCIGEEAYASHLLYRMGKYFETIRGKKELAKFYYDRSYKVDSYNYRAIYKKAIFYLDEDKLDMSLQYFQEILEILGRKKRLPSLQPIECAYLYKANRSIGEIYLKKSKYMEAIRYLKEAITFGTNMSNMVFYNWMFRDKAELFKRAAVEKLKLHQCYDNLADAYVMTNQSDEVVQLIKEYRSFKSDQEVGGEE